MPFSLRHEIGDLLQVLFIEPVYFFGLPGLPLQEPPFRSQHVQRGLNVFSAPFTLTFRQPPFKNPLGCVLRIRIVHAVVKYSPDHLVNFSG